MNLYLPIEILNREFYSKLLIGMESASKGINVYIGRLKEYLLRDFFDPGIIIYKSITPSDQRLEELKFFKNKKFIITSLDEEDGLINANKKYLIERFSNESIDLTDCVFTWGKFDHDNLSNKYTEHKKKFIKSGNPRVDFWRKDFESYFKKRNLPYTNYIFFSLNLCIKSKKEFNERWKSLQSWGYTKRGITIGREKRIYNDSHKMFKKFSELIIKLSNQTNSLIIVRPHPIDDIRHYDHLKKYSNIKVIKEGNISDWIYHSKVVIHSNCTGGLEASLRGKATISYQPFKSLHGHKFASNYSRKIKSLDECLNLIHKLTNNKKYTPINTKNFKLRAYNYLSNKPAYKTITEELIKLMKSNNFKKKKNNFFLNIRFLIRDLRSKILNLNYGNIKFSFFDKKKVLKTFEDLKVLEPKYSNLRLNFIKKDIIQIRRIS